MTEPFIPDPCLQDNPRSRKENSMEWQDRISMDPKVLVGKPVIKGTRIAVEFVIDLLGCGWTTDQILHEYDHLSPHDIQACLAYASEVLKSERVYLFPAGPPR
jgi:uncharacterized protein (DUF433 family)